MFLFISHFVFRRQQADFSQKVRGRLKKTFFCASLEMFGPSCFVILELQLLCQEKVHYAIFMSAFVTKLKPNASYISFYVPLVFNLDQKHFSILNCFSFVDYFLTNNLEFFKFVTKQEYFLISNNEIFHQYVQSNVVHTYLSNEF